MPGSEAEIENKVIGFARRHGWFAIKLNPTWNRGVPDRLLLRPGHILFVEFKKPTGRLSELQKDDIRYLRRVGFSVIISGHDAKSIYKLQRYLKKHGYSETVEAKGSA